MLNNTTAKGSGNRVQVVTSGPVSTIFRDSYSNPYIVVFTKKMNDYFCMVNSKKSWITKGIKAGLILIIVTTVLLFTLIVVLRILVDSLLSGPTITIHNDSQEAFNIVVAMHTDDNPQWLIKIGPRSFSSNEDIKLKQAGSRFSCLYIFTDSSPTPLHAYNLPAAPDKISENSFSPNNEIYNISSFSQPCYLGNFLPTFKYNAEL